MPIIKNGWGATDILGGESIWKPMDRKLRRGHQMVIHASEVFVATPLHGLLLGADAPHDLAIFQQPMGLLLIVYPDVQ